MLYRTEVKYLLIGVVVLGALAAFSDTQPANTMMDGLTHALQSAIGLGVVGVFVSAFIASSTFLVHIPFTALLLVVAATYGSFMDRLWLGVASGLGAGLGEATAYLTVQKLSHSVAAPEESRLIHRLNQMLDERPRLTPMAVFAIAASPLPDYMVLIPVALANIPLRELLLALFSGKLLHTLSLIALIGLLPKRVGTSFLFTFGVLALAIVFMLYQMEKKRASGEPADAQECSSHSSRMSSR